MNEIILYTINCPRCNVLKDKLEQAEIKYRVVSDINKLREKGITQLPILEANGKRLDFPEALKLLKGGDLK